MSEQGTAAEIGDSPTLVALLPMRHHSQRVPGKNYRNLGGRPLFHHILVELLGCPLISKVVIDTDSPVIIEDAERCFPQAQIIERPEHLRADATPMNDVLLHDVRHVDADFYLQTHSTNPLLRMQTISRAIGLFLENYPTHDSLFAATRLQTRIWDQLARPINHNPAILLQTQDLPPVYEENSNLYIFPRDVIESRHNRIGERPLIFEVDRLEAWDIDEESDFLIAELLYSQQDKLRSLVEPDL